jgi:hypothetical protein
LPRLGTSDTIGDVNAWVNVTATNAVCPDIPGHDPVEIDTPGAASGTPHPLATVVAYVVARVWL